MTAHDVDSGYCRLGKTLIRASQGMCQGNPLAPTCGVLVLVAAETLWVHGANSLIANGKIDGFHAFDVFICKWMGDIFASTFVNLNRVLCTCDKPSNHQNRKFPRRFKSGWNNLPRTKLVNIMVGQLLGCLDTNMFEDGRSGGFTKMTKSTRKKAAPDPRKHLIEKRGCVRDTKRAK